MYGMGLGYALNCILRMLEIFSRGREPELEGNDSLVVVAVEKQERVYLKRWRRRWRKPVNVVTPIRTVSRPRERACHAFSKGGSTQTLRFPSTAGNAVHGQAAEGLSGGREMFSVDSCQLTSGR